MDHELEVMIVAWSTLIGAVVKRTVESDGVFKVTAVARPTGRAFPDFGGRRPAAAVIAGACAPQPRGPAIVSAVERVRERLPATQVVTVMPEDCLCMHYLNRLLQSGVVACLDWDISEPELLRSLHAACEGSSYHSRAVSLLLRKYVSAKTSTGTRGATRELSPVELEVAQLLLESLTLDQIASRLGRAKGTVQTQCKRIYDKLGICDRAGLFRWWVNCGHDGNGGGKQGASGLR